MVDHSLISGPFMRVRVCQDEACVATWKTHSTSLLLVSALYETSYCNSTNQFRLIDAASPLVWRESSLVVTR